MKKTNKLIVALFLLSYPFFALAVTDVYPFADAHQRARFNYLTAQFRCLVCQNENLAASSAPLAQDLRRHIYQMIQHWRSNQAIKDYMVSRYGNFILLNPPVEKTTWLLWFGPFIFLLLGLLILFSVWRRRAVPALNQADPKLHNPS